MNRKQESDNPFERIDMLIEKQKSDIEDIRQKISDYKDKEKKALGKLEALEHQRIVEIVEYSAISTDMLKQLMLAARADNMSVQKAANSRKEVRPDEDDTDYDEEDTETDYDEIEYENEDTLSDEEDTE